MAYDSNDCYHSGEVELGYRGECSMHSTAKPIVVNQAATTGHGTPLPFFVYNSCAEVISICRQINYITILDRLVSYGFDPTINDNHSCSEV